MKIVAITLAALTLALATVPASAAPFSYNQAWGYAESHDK